MQPNLQDNIAARVFYLIRRHDVELAEDFLRRSQTGYKTVQELNQFFQGLVAQYPKNNQPRLALPVTDNLDIWLRDFEANVLPVLRRLRLPPCMDRTSHPFYQAAMAFFPHKSAAVA